MSFTIHTTPAEFGAGTAPSNEGRRSVRTGQNLSQEPMSTWPFWQSLARRWHSPKSGDKTVATPSCIEILTTIPLTVSLPSEYWNKVHFCQLPIHHHSLIHWVKLQNFEQANNLHSRFCHQLLFPDSTGSAADCNKDEHRDGVAWQYSQYFFKKFACFITFWLRIFIRIVKVQMKVILQAKWRNSECSAPSVHSCHSTHCCVIAGRILWSDVKGYVMWH